MVEFGVSLHVAPTEKLTPREVVLQKSTIARRRKTVTPSADEERCGAAALAAETSSLMERQ